MTAEWAAFQSTSHSSRDEVLGDRESWIMNYRNLLAIGSCSVLFSLLVVTTIPASAQADAAPPTVSNAPEEVRNANQVLLGESKGLTYEQAIAVVDRYAAQGDLMALRMNTVIWRMDLPAHARHRTSHVATYLGARRLLLRSPNDQVAQLLTDPDEFRDLGDAVGDLGYLESIDPMTDARRCQLTTTSEQGVVLGLDNVGIFVWGEPTTSLEDYAKFAVRVDSHAAFFGTTPTSVTEKQKKLDAAARLAARQLMTMSEYERKVSEITAAVPATERVYVAQVGTQQYETLLKQLALGDEVRARVVLPGGSERVVSWSLLIRDGSLPKPINYFDLLGYRYVNCVYGRQ